MMRALSTAASGMDAQQTHLDVTANNIANVSTPGFKRNHAEFAEMMVQVQRAPGRQVADGVQAPVGLEVGLGVRTLGTAREHGQGDLKASDNPFDLAIQGDGFFQVETPSGDRLYTRVGQLKTDADGRLVTTSGFPLVGDLRVPADTEQLLVSSTGMVSARLRNEPVEIEVGQLELAQFVNPQGLVAEGKSFFRETVASGPPTVARPGEQGLGSIEQFSIEQSNVQMVEEMVDLISGQRAYEVNARVIKAADEMLQQATNLR
jgi:flagellar basal-body rod protein FlgG